MHTQHQEFSAKKQAENKKALDKERTFQRRWLERQKSTGPVLHEGPGKKETRGIFLTLPRGVGTAKHRHRDSPALQRLCGLLHA